MKWHTSLLLTSLLATSSLFVCAEGWDVAVNEEQQTSKERSETAASKRNPLGDDEIELKLCDCQEANGSPGNLSCDKEGFFVTSFKRQGQWVSGGGAVPLSPAVCCRPCLPKELPSNEDGSIREGQDAIAVFSYGCHASTASIPVRCEEGGRSFVNGFTDAVRIFTRVDTFYPVNNAQCCTPSLLLEDGDAWELERCGCHYSENKDYPVNCNGEETDELLAGFDAYRTTPMGQIVPVGPARCCRVCLSRSTHPSSGCSDLNHCSGNGVCSLGRCECLRGWGGSDCSQPTGSSIWHGQVPPWAVVLIVIGSCLLASMLLLSGVNILSWVQERAERQEREDEEEGREPLLLRIDADDTGSVGSDDTDYGEMELEEEVEQRIEHVIQDLQERQNAADAVDEGGQEEQHAEMQATEGVSAGEAADTEIEVDPELGLPRQQAVDQPAASEDQEQATSIIQNDSRPDQEEVEEVVDEETDEIRSHNNQQGAPAITIEAAAEPGNSSPADGDSTEEPQKDPAGALRLGGFDSVGPLSSVDCTVCMIRPVQTVLVPCGHICMCRRCSRRLDRCPICRKDIARRQRLFV